MDNIPYTVHERSDTGFNNATLGIWVFIASEIMLFGGLFSAYVVLRSGSAFWPSGSSVLNIPLATLNTVLLIISSVAVVFAWAALKEKNISKFRTCWIVSLLGGIGFLCLKAFEYGIDFKEGLFPSTNTFMAIYFTLTGLHALHIIGGLVVNAYLLGPGFGMYKKDPEHYAHRIEVAGIYWHFVDILWLVLLFPVLYLL